MGWNDHLEDTQTCVVTCPFCGRNYEVTYIEQAPGCRMKDDEICPYCGKIIRSSMEYDSFTRKLEE